MTIGILALQGDYAAHRAVLESLGVGRVLDVRTADELAVCDGLVLPGGESTTMSRLCDRYSLWAPLQQKLAGGMGAFGTCAGLILLAKKIEGATPNFPQKTLGALDVDVARNAYGAQADSFECNLNWEPNIEYSMRDNPGSKRLDFGSQDSLRAVFIRAPRIVRVGENVETLARHDGEAVAVRFEKIVGCAFHPEIAGENRLHRLWLRSLSR